MLKWQPTINPDAINLILSVSNSSLDKLFWEPVLPLIHKNNKKKAINIIMYRLSTSIIGYGMRVQLSY